MSSEVTYEFAVGNWGRSISDKDWEVVDAAHIEAWRSACTLLAERQLNHQNIVYDLEMDWSPSLRAYRRGFAALKKMYSIRKDVPVDKREAAFFALKWPQRAAKNKIVVRSDGEDRHLPLQVVESTLADFFVVMNLASPGCCDFYGAKLGSSRLYPDLSFSSAQFEISQLRGSEGRWPNILFLELNKTISWFDSVRTPLGQLPKNPMERAIFSIFYISKMELAPATIIWLFYALESLFQTRPGENLTTLFERVRDLLEPDDREAKFLKKNMRKLYDQRSAIVHGGMEVMHPLFAEMLDPKVSDKFFELDDVVGFGFSVLLACIQKCIENEWKYPTYSETTSGVPISARN